MSGRVVALIDMDCFYVQVEQRERPELRGKPCAVVQYNQWKGGAIIAVGYEARAHGVSRHMRGDEAKARCPEIELCTVPCVRGKADLQRYREAGAEVLRVLAQFGGALERASIDEAYLDVTDIIDREIPGLPAPSALPSSFLVGRDDSSADQWLPDLLDEGPESARLAQGAVLVERMRAAVFEQTQFHCSAGIASNKVLAKFACGLHKPNRQTILPPSAVDELFNQLPVKKLRHLGGKLGSALSEDLGVETMGQLRDRFSERQLSEHFGSKTGRWLFELARGRDSEPVVGRQLAKSIGCSKSFPGTTVLDTRSKVTHWVEQLAEEIVERLERDRGQNNRVARNLVVFVAHQSHPRPTSATRTCALTRYDVGKISHDAMVLLRPFNSTAHGSEVWSPALTYLGLSAGKFAELQQQDGPSIRDLFTKSAASTPIPSDSSFNSSAITPSTSQGITPSRQLTYFERLGQLQKKREEEAKEKEEEEEARKEESCERPSFFERRLKMIRQAAEAAETEADAVEAEADAVETEADAVETEADAVETEAEAIEAEERRPALQHSDSDFMSCSECGARILIFEMPEHADRHVAERLHREIQKEMEAEAEEGRRKEAQPRPAPKRRGRPPGSSKAKRAKSEAGFSLDKFLR